MPDVPGQAWEPEQVQLCAQGLILRENGYLCEGGILYYVDSRKRISIPFDEPLVDRTRELLRAIAGHGRAAGHAAAVGRQPEMPALLAGRHLPARRNPLLQLRDAAQPLSPTALPEGEERSRSAA